jgi:hypothetical protein
LVYPRTSGLFRVQFVVDVFVFGSGYNGSGYPEIFKFTTIDPVTDIDVLNPRSRRTAAAPLHQGLYVWSVTFEQPLD